MNLLLFLVAWILIPPLTIWNLIVVYQRHGSIKGYFRSTALSIDVWANMEFRTLWNTLLRIEGGYEFGKTGETISSALGKNQRDKTLTKKGKLLVKILDFLDENHCKNSIDLTKGDWYFEPE